MKASELIEELKKQIDENGDLDVMSFDDNEGEYISIDQIMIHSVSNHTKEDDDAELDVFVLE